MDAATTRNSSTQRTTDAGFPFDRIRERYLYMEPALLAAIRHQDRREARRLVNGLLVHIYSVGEEHAELLKSLLLELVVMISRAAVEAGAPQTEVLGMRFTHLTELAEIEDDEALSAWLRNTLERIFDAMERHQTFEVPRLISKVLGYLRENVSRELTREEVGRYAGVSPGHLSHLLKERTGRSFSELARETRVQHACDLLLLTEKPLAEIAADCGFCDQSYLTRVFREVKNVTPKQFRVGARPQAEAECLTRA